ncbi:hypothetical protein C8J57DRAFT_1466659 [Mycena rebaudengoi]|nr:hypothetical protein C8J57DRAFT_1466659 [Mycena rebaudengoi]
MPPPTRLDEASATAHQWCTICQTNPRMSVYQPIAVSALEICVAVGSSTDTTLMKLALYAVDETALLLNSSQVGPVPPEFLALLEAILDDIRRHIENAQISTNKRGNLFSRHMSSSRLKNELKNQLKTMLRGGQPAPPTSRENTVEILSVSLRASAAICEAPPLNFLKPIVGLAALICETAKTAKSNRDAAEELAKRAINVMNCVVERAWKNGTVSETNEDALNILKRILEDVHSYLIFLNKRRRAMSWMLATQEKDRVAQLNAGLDRALSLFMTTCVLSSNECLQSSNELVRSNTIQLDLLGSTVKQLDGEMSQNFAVGWLGEDGLGCCVPTLKPPDGVALAEAYRRLESESDGADGKEALERFVEARTALVAEAERHLIAASHAPADVTEGSYSIMDSPYLDISGRSLGGTSILPHTLVDARPPTALTPSVSTTSAPPPPLPLAYPTPTGYNKALPHLLPILHAAHSARLVRVRAGCRAHAAGVALVDDELAREKAEELAGGGADAEVDVGEAGAQEQHVAWRDLGSTSARASWKTRGCGRGGGCGCARSRSRRCAADVFTCLGSWCPAGASGGRARTCILQSFWEGESAALRVRGCGAREARAAEMDGVDARRGGREGEEGADVAGGRAAHGGGGKGCGGGACGGRAQRERECTVAVHKDKAHAQDPAPGAGRALYVLPRRCCPRRGPSRSIGTAARGGLAAGGADRGWNLCRGVARWNRRRR